MKIEENDVVCMVLDNLVRIRPQGNRMLMKTIMITGTLCLLLEGIAMAVEPGSFEEQSACYKWVCQPKEGLPNVLILGDSISIGYTLGVREQLDGVANVYRPVVLSGAEKGTPQNCLDSSVSLRCLPGWLTSADQWNVIHFNCGLHDLRRNNPDNMKGDPGLPNNVSVKKYEENLQRIVDILKKTGAKLIFATTTPVPEGVVPCRLSEDVVRYNQVACRVMQKNGVEVNDLYALAKDRLKKIQQPQNVHFNGNGNQVLANAVVERIAGALSGTLGN